MTDQKPNYTYYKTSLEAAKVCKKGQHVYYRPEKGWFCQTNEERKCGL